jgi:hypothetical protein
MAVDPSASEAIVEIAAEIEEQVWEWINALLLETDDPVST